MAGSRQQLRGRAAGRDFGEDFHQQEFHQATFGMTGSVVTLRRPPACPVIQIAVILEKWNTGTAKFTMAVGPLAVNTGCSVIRRKLELLAVAAVGVKGASLAQL